MDAALQIEIPTAFLEEATIISWTLLKHRYLKVHVCVCAYIYINVYVSFNLTQLKICYTHYSWSCDFSLNTVIWRSLYIRLQKATSSLLIAYFTAWSCHNLLNRWPLMNIYAISSSSLLHTIFIHIALYTWLEYLLNKFLEVKFLSNGKWSFNFDRYCQIAFKGIRPFIFWSTVHQSAFVLIPPASAIYYQTFWSF